MRKMIKRLYACVLIMIMCALSVPTTEVSVLADDDTWYNHGGYLTPDEAQTYNIELDEDTKAGVAVGGTIKLVYDEYSGGEDTSYEWKVTQGNEHIRLDATDDKKTIRVCGLSTGTARVEVTVTGYKGTEYESVYTRSVDIEVTNPRLKSDKVAQVIGNEGKIEVEGNASCAQDRILYKADSDDSFNLYGDGSFYGYTKQTRTITVFVDGITLTATVKYTDPQFRSSEILKKGQKASYKVSGASGYTPVIYKTGNTKYATVTKNGLVKGIKYGKTTLTISADNATISFNIYILKSKVYKGVNKAHAICKSKPTYSQPKRMKKGYVDCSSFVWKSYKAAGVTFGSKNNAPTAADLANYCAKKKRLLKLSAYNGKSDKLLPGDLIFYRKRSGKNGRYKNIDHVAMYVGNDTIVHADGSSVSYSYPWYRKVAAIARPVK